MISRKCILYLCLTTVQCFSIGNEFRVGEMLPKDFSRAIVDLAAGLPTRAITIVRGNSTNISTEVIDNLIYALSKNNIGVVYMDFRANNSKSTYYEHQRKGLDTSEERTSFILCEAYECENIISELTDINFIHRSMLYIFYWEHGAVSTKFCDSIEEAMRVVVVTRRKCVYRIYYNQATPDRLNHLSLVNWWAGRLYKNPVLPAADKVYKNFRGRVFNVPVLHAPPWHFVNYKNSSVNVTGGRDDKLLALLAGKLNFKYKYYDPPVRSQGSMISGNGTFKGVLGLIWKRQADFFLGDVTITWERLQAVEFSFLTLADSAAFLTHAPDKLSETLVIIRPFQWQVWPLVCATLLVIGPALWFVIATPMYWQRRQQNMLQLLDECCWFTTTLFLRQTSNKEPSRSNKARLVSIIISLGATYVIGDMYSANLTSLMAKPAKEQPIGTLEGLEEAMRERGYELVVEKHSSTLTILQMSRSKKILDMLQKTDAERPELSAPFSNVPTDYTKKSVNTALNVDDNDIRQQSSPLPSGAEEISQELADIWEEVLHEDGGTEEITCDSPIPNVSDPSAKDVYSNQPSTFSLEVPSSFENSPLIQLEELLEVSHHRSTPVNLELSLPTPMPSPTNLHSICDSSFCPNHADLLSMISSSSFSTTNSPSSSHVSYATVTPKTTRKRQRRPKEWTDVKRKCLKNL
ncbi:unnamed protein product [Pieris macdunnoughi]|uniref:Uncharacterized protein n=1 Tax=Pieris macdunnoughi TaxID=345717 RepID=A0A821LSP8_9NEOP|nr:unnamed protein product [Pieris macdunnoughi]